MIFKPEATGTPEITQELIRSMLNVIQQAFKDTRSLILNNAGKIAFITKPDGSPVTAIDREVEKFVTNTMTSRYPGIPLFGEESGYEDTLPEICWLIDPIDGTKSYIDNIPAYTSMGVLIHAGSAIASIIYNPITDEVFTAILGKGAYKNGQRLDISKLPLPKEVFCKTQHIKVLTQLLNKGGIQAIVGPSGAGYGLSQVADNKTAARFHLHSGGYIHDHAPGALLVKEAGGDIIPVLENTYTYRTRSFVACHPELSDLIHEQLSVLRELEDPNQALK